MAIELSGTVLINEWTYYSEYIGTFCLMGLPVMSDTAWEKVVAWLGKHVEALAKSSCEQVQKRITNRGDKL